VLLDQLEIAFLAKLLRIGRLAPDETKAGDPPSLLIDSDERFDLAEVTQIVDQFAKLIRRFDVSSEENETTGLEFLESSSVPGTPVRSIWPRGALLCISESSPDRNGCSNGIQKISPHKRRDPTCPARSGFQKF
jgi:hypothetical protein